MTKEECKSVAAQMPFYYKDIAFVDAYALNHSCSVDMMLNLLNLTIAQGQGFGVMAIMNTLAAVKNIPWNKGMMDLAWEAYNRFDVNKDY